ncbi:DNA-binding transcriptional activator of the SARP family [Frankia canadensis]|uniref:DNA-binding transcriptional activator of the SARP family n=1 Tax=Frankia canadensis TaxID=1836972 RepID=A0A2I2KQZ9_9ACTN|nr:AfsR/SARP family transcriptional regulator [Frankia canadensis]SNQ48095.1 DNA-binding transcriptional activator of the SARP family [Frankia canadensis]SOU55385.1 DNA-binding transcriptional activator of the SARP family [Frankia canadensis]
MVDERATVPDLAIRCGPRVPGMSVVEPSSWGGSATRWRGPGALFAVLGPLEVWRPSGDQVRIDQRKKRALLLTLLLHADRWTSIEEMRLALWQDSPPRSALGNIKTYLSELRHTLPPPPGAPADRRHVAAVGPGSGVLFRPVGPGRIESRPGHYRLIVQPDEIDLVRFEQDVERGRAAVRDGSPRRAVGLFERALGWWRGDAFDELPAEVAGTESLRLEESRWAVHEDLIDARLALGEFDEVLPVLRAFTLEFPTRERLWAQLLVALERSGRRAEALSEYRTLHRRLVADFGIEPGVALRRVHQHVLEAEPDCPGARSGPADAHSR